MPRVQIASQKTLNRLDAGGHAADLPQALCNASSICFNICIWQTIYSNGSVLNRNELQVVYTWHSRREFL